MLRAHNCLISELLTCTRHSFVTWNFDLVLDIYIVTRYRSLLQSFHAFLKGNIILCFTTYFSVCENLDELFMHLCWWLLMLIWGNDLKQGDCRHTIVIRDMRLIHTQDVQNRAAYPILLFQLKPHIRKCYVCKIFRATQVTIDDKWAQENPCYFCDNCYYLLHYKDGCLLYDDFSVHEYRHD